MTKKSINTRLMKLTSKFNSIDQVKSIILNKRHESSLNLKKDKQNLLTTLGSDEKSFLSMWSTNNPNIEEIYIPNIVDGETESNRLVRKYAVLEAIVEYSKNKKFDSEGMLLPKIERTNIDKIKIIFFEYNNQVFVIIYSNYDPNIYRVKKILGEENIDEDHDGYKISSDMFTWMFFKYSSFAGILDQTLKIKNIAGFMGNISDEHNVFRGDSEQTSELIMTKAFISNGEKIKNLIVRAVDEMIDGTLRIDEYSNINMNINMSEIRGQFIAEDKEFFIPLYSYLYLIPRMIYLYKIDSKTFIETDKKNFSAKIGEEVILSILEKNNIDIGLISKKVVQTRNSKLLTLEKTGTL
ncbi:hypothetical protein LABALGNA3A7_16430 [Dellaglioa algida]|nr:hypothetical protein LABALGNA3A7_16430 [Dellaglioa algida]